MVNKNSKNSKMVNTKFYLVFKNIKTLKNKEQNFKHHKLTVQNMD